MLSKKVTHVKFGEVMRFEKKRRGEFRTLSNI